MGRLDLLEKDLQTEKREYKEDVERLEAIIVEKDREIKNLKDDNERMRRILNNDRICGFINAISEKCQKMKISAKSFVGHRLYFSRKAEL